LPDRFRRTKLKHDSEFYVGENATLTHPVRQTIENFSMKAELVIAVTATPQGVRPRRPTGPRGTALARHRATDMRRSPSRLPALVRQSILRLRGQNVMLDADLARMYAVDVRVLNQAVKRNRQRFPADFMFQLSQAEEAFLRSQIVILESGRGTHRKYRSFAFTEQGVAMLSSVLRSPRAIAVNIEIMRAFVQLRRMLDSNAELAHKVAELERTYDGNFKAVFEAIRQLMAPPATSAKRIGFRR